MNFEGITEDVQQAYAAGRLNRLVSRITVAARNCELRMVTKYSLSSDETSELQDAGFEVTITSRGTIIDWSSLVEQ